MGFILEMSNTRADSFGGPRVGKLDGIKIGGPDGPKADGLNKPNN